MSGWRSQQAEPVQRDRRRENVSHGSHDITEAVIGFLLVAD